MILIKTPAMDTVTTIAALRQRLSPHRQTGRRIGFAPTMGGLHRGHMHLIDRAREENAVSVVSIFVNPLQFGENEDLARYPQDLARDSAMLENAGVDFLFAPTVAEMTPESMQTVIDLPDLGSMLEGEVRPGHFAGVATIVTKFFNIIQPDCAYFGEKDYQQLAIIRKMVEDLALPLRVVAVPTVREEDGLACSSRNVYLSSRERRAAAIVPQALKEAARLMQSGLCDPRGIESRLLAFLKTEPLAEPEIVALRHPETLAPLQRIGEPALVLLYVRFGTTRLLDNRVIVPGAAYNPKVAFS